ncbi:GPH family glycoside/pentoside/hexuronide:cation symporter [Clostridium algifaecis]|uniref:GPH family glycoside/pentoside/hexuronide:cation symporter n=1 Tax=Clostridium algifaecis TaxID=1472040 RepID=A0ABS4KRJ0_9CLOT|nr:glycoside-pentoside-hexuronide (GPH):cation symporter [Clostridium algifaecis]MBP2032648.1 GPH family glycoside/pentoside/hexuronide:cation symporter [Clostridium algifaecis]
MENKTKHKLTLKEKISYGFGDLGNGFMFDLGQSYLLKFYTDVLRIPGAVGGSVFLISKIFDAFADTTVGTAVDSRKNIGKRGKFRPFILFATVPLAIATVLTFLAPNISMGAKIAYAYITYMIFGLAYSCINIPYGSLAASMTQDPVERTQLASFRQAGSSIALLITGITVIPIILKFSDPKIGYPVTMGLMALIGVIFHIICYKNTKEHIIVNNPDKKKESLSMIFKALCSNKPLMVLNLMSLLTISCYNLKIAMMVYYAQYNLGNPKLTATLNFVSIGCSLIGVAIMPFVVKKIGKKATYLLGLFIWVGADLINYLLPGSVTTFMILSAIAWFGTAFMNGLNWAFISDAIEYGEWKTGERTEGIIYSTYSFGRKVAQALAGFIPGVVLTIIGYVPNVQQTARTLSGLKSLMLLVPAIGAGIAILAFIFLYDLTDEKYKQILVELEERKSSKVMR